MDVVRAHGQSLRPRGRAPAADGSLRRNGRHRCTPGRAGLAGLIAVPLVLTGCASHAGASATSTAASTTASVTHATTADTAAAIQYASNRPPAPAQMICSDELRGKLADALAVASVPAPHATWAEHVQTCTYTVPMGRLILSVTVTPRSAAAKQQLAAMRGALGRTQPEPGLGEQAYSTESGTVIAVKDNMVLRVDATGLPDDLGRTHEQRTDLARIIAAEIVSCWAGTS